MKQKKINLKTSNEFKIFSQSVTFLQRKILQYYNIKII